MQKRTNISRGKNRGVEDISEIYKILDEGLICHIAFIRNGYPVVLPTNYARHKNQIIVHGGNESPFYQALAAANDICLTVTLLDGLVLGKSAYNHSVNYRSVVIFGKAKQILDNNEKIENLKVLIDHVVKNRWESVRTPAEKELNATMVLSIPIQEYSAKMRTGKPNVIASDETYPVWSGVLPLETRPGIPEADEFSQNLTADYFIENYSRK